MEQKLLELVLVKYLKMKARKTNYLITQKKEKSRS